MNSVRSIFQILSYSSWKKNLVFNPFLIEAYHLNISIWTFHLQYDPPPPRWFIIVAQITISPLHKDKSTSNIYLQVKGKDIAVYLTRKVFNSYNFSIGSFKQEIRKSLSQRNRKWKFPVKRNKNMDFQFILLLRQK